MNGKREEIIRQAIIDKLGDGINFYTAEDILTVSEIDGAELKKIETKIAETVNCNAVSKGKGKALSKKDRNSG